MSEIVRNKRNEIVLPICLFEFALWWSMRALRKAPRWTAHTTHSCWAWRETQPTPHKTQAFWLFSWLLCLLDCIKCGFCALTYLDSSSSWSIVQQSQLTNASTRFQCVDLTDIGDSDGQFTWLDHVPCLLLVCKTFRSMFLILTLNIFRRKLLENFPFRCSLEMFQ